MDKKNLRLVIALNIEAAKIIQLYKLKKNYSYQNIFKIYNNLDLNIWLVVSGIGNVNTAAAAMYLYETSPKNNKNIWVNIGMGGCKNFKVGSIFNIKKVTFKTKEKVENFYTSALINTRVPINEVINVDSIESSFVKKSSVYEMEAYGFIKVVEKFCSRELICIIKIISDNENSPPADFISTVNYHIDANIKEIERLIDNYIKISYQIKENKVTNISFIQKKFYLTFSNKIIIEDLARKVEKISSRKNLEKLIFESKTLKELIKKLKNKINNYILKI